MEAGAPRRRRKYTRSAPLRVSRSVCTYGRSIFTDVLITDLCRDEEAGWDTYYKRGLDPKDLASLLRHYGIKSTTVNIKGKRAKGYRLDAFQDAWERYL